MIVQRNFYGAGARRKRECRDRAAARNSGRRVGKIAQNIAGHDGILVRRDRGDLIQTEQHKAADADLRLDVHDVEGVETAADVVDNDDRTARHRRKGHGNAVVALDGAAGGPSARIGR